MKASLVWVLILLAGCSWFRPKQPLPTAPAELIVTGAPAGSQIYVDGVLTHPTHEGEAATRVLDVRAGSHTLEVRTDATVSYRESFDVQPTETRTITVLSGRPPAH